MMAEPSDRKKRVYSTEDSARKRKNDSARKKRDTRVSNVVPFSAGLRQGKREPNQHGTGRWVNAKHQFGGEGLSRLQ